MPRKPAPNHQLTPRQLEIMDVIWTRGEASVLEVRDALAKTREVARNTVRTTMERLERAGYLTHRVVGRTWLYSALVGKSDTVGSKALDIVNRVFGGRPEALVSALVEHRGLASDEIDRIEALLHEARSRKSKTRGRKP